MQVRRRDGFDHEMGFEKKRVAGRGFPNTERAVAGFDAEDGVDGGTHERVVGREEPDVLARESPGAVEGEHRPVGRETGQGGVLRGTGFQEVGPAAEFLDPRPEVVEHPDEERLEFHIGILPPDRLDERVGNRRAVGVQLEKAVTPALEALGGFFVCGGGGFHQGIQRGGVECFQELRELRAKLRRHLGCGVGIFFEGIETFVIPARKNLFGAAGNERDVDVDRRGLPDAVEAADALLEQFGVGRQIEEDEVVRKLEIAALAANLRAGEEARAVRLGEERRVAVALQQGELLVEGGGGDFYALLEAVENLHGEFLRTADEQDFFFFQFAQLGTEPFDFLADRVIRCRKCCGEGFPFGEPAEGGTGVAEHHAAGAEFVEQSRNDTVSRGGVAGAELFVFSRHPAA